MEMLFGDCEVEGAQDGVGRSGQLGWGLSRRRRGDSRAAVEVVFGTEDNRLAILDSLDLYSIAEGDQPRFLAPRSAASGLTL